MKPKKKPSVLVQMRFNEDLLRQIDEFTVRLQAEKPQFVVNRSVAIRSLLIEADAK